MTKELLSFVEFFCIATGSFPYPYQEALAVSGARFPSLLHIPTGAGKTAAVTLSWLWRRRFSGDHSLREQTPRRLVYCLPMRALSEQTHGTIVLWLHRLKLLGGLATFDKEGKLLAYDPFSDAAETEGIRVHLLMGGEIDRDWDRYPERDAILVGTQDQLLSRALNRGYAMSRYRWPLHFALLNSDALWIFDEVQLMGNGLATSLQLAGFYRDFGLAAESGSVWMSATLHPGWMRTVDAPKLDSPLCLSNADMDNSALARRMRASKPIRLVKSNPKNKGKDEAQIVQAHHREHCRTLVVVNTVRRAQEIFRELVKAYRPKGKKGPQADNDTFPAPEIILLHSRFREPERAGKLARLHTTPGSGGIIAVSTQVVEAGMDVSARLLVTDLAPWPSLVQRFGRCNRAGEDEDARILWLDVPDKLARPYTVEELTEARGRLRNLDNARPDTLPEVDGAPGWRNVIRRRDLLDLFDTSPDLSGADIDVSRFIREGDEHDAQVFWRSIPKDGVPEPMEPQPKRDELCSVPVGDLRGMKADSFRAWRWDHQEKEWEAVSPDQVYPGMVLMLAADSGGYAPDDGWTGGKTPPVQPMMTEKFPASMEEDGVGEAHDDDLYAEGRKEWESIAEHTDKVVAALDSLLASLPKLPEDLENALRLAARWHDLGKTHEQFQTAATWGVSPPSAGPWGKAPHRMRPYTRRGFRHELASALAMLQHGLPDLSAFLAAAHHGKVRLSIRSMPFEKPYPENPQALYARGLREGDILPACDLGGSVHSPETILDLSFMELGEGPQGPSWLARALALRDDPGLGPFRLAYLEAILRLADWRVSAGGAR